MLHGFRSKFSLNQFLQQTTSKIFHESPEKERFLNGQMMKIFSADYLSKYEMNFDY
jgi:hypothetical protein